MYGDLATQKKRMRRVDFGKMIANGILFLASVLTLLLVAGVFGFAYFVFINFLMK